MFVLKDYWFSFYQATVMFHMFDVSVELNFSGGNLSWEQAQSDNGVVGEGVHTEDIPDDIGCVKDHANKHNDDCVDEVSKPFTVRGHTCN